MFFISCTKEAETRTVPFFHHGDDWTVGGDDWSKESCYNTSIDIAGPIDTYTHGLWNMAVTGSVAALKSETGGKSTSGQIPTGNQLGDDPEGAGYASQMLLDGYVYAMYHPTSGAPDHFIVYHINTGNWWRYDLGNNERRCTVMLIMNG